MTDDATGELYRVRNELQQLRNELTAAYDLLASRDDEIRRLRREFKATLDDMVQDCNDILREIQK